MHQAVQATLLSLASYNYPSFPAIPFRQPLCPLVSGYLAWQSIILTASGKKGGGGRGETDRWAPLWLSDMGHNFNHFSSSSFFSFVFFASTFHSSTTYSSLTPPAVTCFFPNTTLLPHTAPHVRLFPPPSSPLLSPSKTYFTPLYADPCNHSTPLRLCAPSLLGSVLLCCWQPFWKPERAYRKRGARV